jgi:uncharacterized protein
VKARLLGLLTACLLGQAVLLHADFKVPALSGPVVDKAGMLSADGADQIGQAIQKLWNEGGSQYAVLTVPDLGGEVIEQASIKVTDAWKLGQKGKDNGVLIIISKADRKVRIEVGQGLEGDLTDAFCSDVVRDTMVPLLREGRADEALLSALALLIQKSDPNFSLQGLPAPAQGGDAGIGAGAMLFILMIVLVFGFRLLPFFFMMGGMGGGRFRGFGGFGGGSFGGGFGGGGGFSGGGGGFSGGGASGGW